MISAELGKQLEAYIQQLVDAGRLAFTTCTTMLMSGWRTVGTTTTCHDAKRGTD